MILVSTEQFLQWMRLEIDLFGHTDMDLGFISPELTGTVPYYDFVQLLQSKRDLRGQQCLCSPLIMVGLFPIKMD